MKITHCEVNSYVGATWTSKELVSRTTASPEGAILALFENIVRNDPSSVDELFKSLMNVLVDELGEGYVAETPTKVKRYSYTMEGAYRDDSNGVWVKYEDYYNDLWSRRVSEEWVCPKCRTIHPASSIGHTLSSILCPKCNELRLPRAAARIAELNRENAELYEKLKDLKCKLTN